jgi:beta-mannosidase
VRFKSPVNYAAEEFNGYVGQYGYPILPSSLAPEYQGENHANMIRKMQASFSWDWGPSFPSMGIWWVIILLSFLFRSWLLDFMESNMLKKGLIKFREHFL